MMRLLDFVALYGLLLVPMGAVIVADYWLLPRLGLAQDYASARRLLISWPAAIAWLGALAFAWLLNATTSLQLFFLGLPAWCFALIAYVALSYVVQRRNAPSAVDITGSQP